MKRFITAMLLLCSTLMLHAAKTDKEVTITVGNESREYWLYVPDNVKAEAPLVVSLHGASGHDTDKSPFRTDVADKEGCIVSACQPLFAFFLVLWLIIGCEVKKDGNRLAKCRLLPSLLYGTL